MAYTAELITADFKTDPYEHQLRNIELHGLDKDHAHLWQMRSGKTKVNIDTICLNVKERGVDAVLLVAPNGVHRNWVERELPAHHWDSVSYQAIAWSTQEGGKTLLDPKSANYNPDIYKQWWDEAESLLKLSKIGGSVPWFCLASSTITRKEVRSLIARVMRRFKRVALIVDESHDYRKPGAKRSMMLRAVSKRAYMTRILTGTVVHNSPLNAWAQYELLQENALGFKTFAEFKQKFALYETLVTKDGRSYPKLVEYINRPLLRDLMAPWSSVVLRSDCKDLPAIVESRRKIEMTDEQKTAYEKIRREFIIEVEGQSVNIGENTNRLAKMAQVASGFIKDEYGEVYRFKKNPKLEALVDEVDLASGKVIVWCQFREDLDRVNAAIQEMGHKTLQYHGRTSEADKAKAREMLRGGQENDIKALVGQVQSGGVGLDLSACSKIIWFSHTFNAIDLDQGNERATKIGGENIPVVYLTAPVIDEYVLDTTNNKLDVADDMAGRGMRETLERLKL